jgi:hypothetical protein
MILPQAVRKVGESSRDHSALALVQVSTVEIPREHERKRRIAGVARRPMLEARHDSRFLASTIAVAPIENGAFEQDDWFPQAMSANIRD